MQSAEGEIRRALLWQQVDAVKNAVINSGHSLGPVQSPILPLMIGDETEAVTRATALRERGVFIPAIRYPTVAKGEARLRLTVTAAHTREDVVELQHALGNVKSDS